MSPYGLLGLIEKEAAYCGKPVIAYTNPECFFDITRKKVRQPFLPHKREPADLAKVIDMIVTSKEFREKLAKEQYEFVIKIAEPKIQTEKFEKLFQNLMKKLHYESNNNVRFRKYLFYLFYYSNIQRIINVKAARVRKDLVGFLQFQK